MGQKVFIVKHRQGEPRRAMPRNAPKEDRGLLMMFVLCQEQPPRFFAMLLNTATKEEGEEFLDFSYPNDLKARLIVFRSSIYHVIVIILSYMNVTLFCIVSDVFSRKSMGSEPFGSCVAERQSSRSVSGSLAAPEDGRRSCGCCPNRLTMWSPGRQASRCLGHVVLEFNPEFGLQEQHEQQEQSFNHTLRYVFCSHIISQKDVFNTLFYI